MFLRRVLRGCAARSHRDVPRRRIPLGYPYRLGEGWFLATSRPEPLDGSLLKERRRLWIGAEVLRGGGDLGLDVAPGGWGRDGPAGFSPDVREGLCWGACAERFASSCG